jgi:hypothetical protein
MRAPAEARMPDRDHWSAGMVLRWVLVRDSDTVLSMLDSFGGVLVEREKVTPIRPLTWDRVVQVYAIDDSLPAEERMRQAVLRAELEIIPAQEKIYGALRRGVLDGWARPNGSGDYVKVEPIQWVGLRFRACDGHDFAVPVDSNQDRLPLPRPLADYLSALVPASDMPMVWVDPVLSGEQAMELWPAASIENPRTLANAPGPKGGGRGAKSVAWEVAEEILADTSRRPMRGHGRLTALARAVQPLLEKRGHSREIDTIVKSIRASFRNWEIENPDE